MAGQEKGFGPGALPMAGRLGLVVSYEGSSESDWTAEPRQGRAREALICSALVGLGVTPYPFEPDAQCNSCPFSCSANAKSHV